MSRRRRIYLLMALLPTTLGVATFAIVDRSERSQDEAWWPAMTGAEAAPEVVQEAQSASAPTGVEVSGTAPATKEAEAPATAPQAPASNQRPIRDDADEAQAPALFADSGPTESASSEGPIRFASIGAPYAGGGGGGGGSHGSSGGKNPQTPNDPQVPPGDDTPPDTGKDQPDQSQGGNSPGTTPPNDDGKQDQGGPSAGGPNPENPNGQTPVDEGGDDGTPPFIPDPVTEKPVQVPEPATLGLFALGLLGCAARRKARK